jgi:exopolysaccharide production protein ExoZ
MFYGIQFLRGVAAIMVVIFHSGLELQTKVGTNVRSFTTVGAAGVDIFFVISGFIMIQTTAAQRFSASSFLYRRFARIVPLYWALTLTFGLLVLLAPAGMFSCRLDTWNFVSSFLFIPTFDYKGEIAPALNQGWTLVYEIFFYLCLTASSVIAFRQRLWVLALGLGALVTLGSQVPYASPAYLTYTNPLLLEFLFGCVIGELEIRGRLNFGPAVAVGLLGLGLTLFALAAGGPTDQRFRFVVWGIPAALIVAAVVRGETFLDLRSWRIANLIGNSSFSLYLIHTFVLTAFGLVFRLGFTHSLKGLPMVPAMVITSVIAGWLCWRHIEQRLVRAFMSSNSAGTTHRPSITPTLVSVSLQPEHVE